MKEKKIEDGKAKGGERWEEGRSRRGEENKK